MNAIFFGAKSKCVVLLSYPKMIEGYRTAVRQASNDEIQCRKFFLWKIKPNSEMLNGFDPSEVQNSSCLGDYYFFGANSAQTTGPNCKAEDGLELVNDFNAQFLEFGLMGYLSEVEVSDEKFAEKSEKLAKVFGNITDHGIQCIMSEFGE